MEAKAKGGRAIPVPSARDAGVAQREDGAKGNVSEGVGVGGRGGEVQGHHAPLLHSGCAAQSRSGRTLRSCQAKQVAEQQSAGRGRLGRNWESQRGASLTFSLGMGLAPSDWSGLSLAVGSSVANSLDPMPAEGAARIRLKWPNDLWLDERKLGGILIETASQAAQRYVIIGIGINICTPDWTLALPGSAATPGVAATGLDALAQPAGRGLDAASALQAIVPDLLAAVARFETRGFAAFEAAFADRDVLAGRMVQLSDGRCGTALGVSSGGALRVQTDTGLQEVSSAEVSVRPAAAAAGQRCAAEPDPNTP